MKRLILLSILLLPFFNAFSQRVANYSYGEPGTKDYEEFSFWVRANKRDEIIYIYGANWHNNRVQYLGKDILNGERCFKLKFANDYILYVIPKGLDLKVSDLNGKYVKYFSWKYEGPVAGGGTFCEPCAENEKDAMKLIKLYYLN